MKKLILITAGILIATASFGQSEEKAIRAMTERQTLAAAHNDLTTYMSTVDPKSPGYEQTKKGMATIFRSYKLNYKVESFKVISITGASALIKVVIKTTKISGPAFRNNRVRMTEKLVKKNGKWLTNDSKMDGVDYLD